MITLRIQNTVLETELRLPCSEAELSQCLREIAITAEPPPKIYVKKMIDPQGFAFLERTSIDVDEMNYLAKRMDSLTRGETDKLYAIVSQKSYMEPKDLINLTFNLDCYTLIQGLRDISSAGRNYLLTVHGGMTSEELSGKDLAKIGRDLIESGKGIYTDYGLLYRNEEIGFEEVYDGQVFPEYWYRGDTGAGTRSTRRCIMKCFRAKWTARIWKRFMKCLISSRIRCIGGIRCRYRTCC